MVEIAKEVVGSTLIDKLVLAIYRYMQQRGKRHTLAMASPEEAQGLQQPTRMRKSGLYGVQRPSGTLFGMQPSFHAFLVGCRLVVPRFRECDFFFYSIHL